MLPMYDIIKIPPIYIVNIWS